MFDGRISKILSVSSGLRGSVRNTASLRFRGCLPSSSRGRPISPNPSGPSACTWRAVLHGELSPDCILRPSQVSYPTDFSLKSPHFKAEGPQLLWGARSTAPGRGGSVGSHSLLASSVSCVGTIWGHGDRSSPALASACLNVITKCHLIPKEIPVF